MNVAADQPVTSQQQTDLASQMGHLSVGGNGGNGDYAGSPAMGMCHVYVSCIMYHV